jgi:hypothetical protein
MEPARAEFEWVACPECGGVATIEWESEMARVLHVKLRCINRHWFLMPAERITRFGSDAPYRDARYATGMVPSVLP